MNFLSSQLGLSSRQTTTNTTTTFTNANDPSNFLTFYNQPPSQELNVDEFLKLGNYRLDLTKGLQNLISNHNLTMTNKKNEQQSSIFEQDTNTLRQAVRKFLKDNQDPSIDNDIISHFILVLTFCIEEKHRRPFIEQETLLFRWRAKLLHDDKRLMSLAQTEGLSIRAFDITPYRAHLDANAPQKESLIEKDQQYVKIIRYLRDNNGGNNKHDIQYYSLPFSTVLDLFTREKTKVVVHKGQAYITNHALVDILTKLYSDRLDLKLTRMHQHLQYAISQHQLLPELIRTLQYGDDTQQSSNTEYTLSEEIMAKDLPSLVPKSFPLCMARIYYGVLRDHHTKHEARGQLNLFFKTIGMPIEEALEWWRIAFLPKFPGDKFDKEYKYNFRHGYGLEGKRGNYSPPGCATCIDKQVGNGETHGCPYKHLTNRDPIAMKNLLHTMMKVTIPEEIIRNEHIDKIIQMANDGHHQRACGYTWSVVHDGQSIQQNITHPMTYWAMSREYYKGGIDNDDIVPTTGSNNTKGGKTMNDDGAATTTTTTTTTKDEKPTVTMGDQD